MAAKQRYNGGKSLPCTGAELTGGEVELVNGNLSYGENPSGLKLPHKAKDGTFKGSFYVYTIMGGRLKKTKVDVTGVFVDGFGLGMATIRNVGC